MCALPCAGAGPVPAMPAEPRRIWLPGRGFLGGVLGVVVELVAVGCLVAVALAVAALALWVA